MSVAKKKINLKASERALLTDTLPYELPLYFTNSNFAVFSYRSRLEQVSIPFYSRLLLSNSNSKPTKPFSFEVRKDESSFRTLSLSHPISQHKMCMFYETYSHFISNICRRSEISLRFPSRVATHYVDPRYKSDAEKKDFDRSSDEDPVGFRDQSRWASTYFSYRDYNLSHKFFESGDFVELERRFAKMLKLDVSRCFASIYTHSIEWSMRGKDFSKEHLPSKNKFTFESEFDSAIRHGNWNETHGILVGPEFSRIFAEIILQSVDRAISKGNSLVTSGRVAIKRYVDDYYIFSNSSEELNATEELIRSSLLELNLHLNESKRAELSRPFVSRISVARREVAAALDRFFEIGSDLAGPDRTTPSPSAIGRATSALLTRIRHVSVEVSSSYDQFVSFSLSVMKNKISELGESDVREPTGQHDHLSRLSWLLAIVRCTQFLYSIDRRPNTTFKLASIYSNVIRTAELLGCARAPIERQILDGLRDPSMGRASSSTDLVTRINHICAVDLLMTQGGRIEISDVKDYIGNVNDPDILDAMNVFQLTAIIFICRRRNRFSEISKIASTEMRSRILSPRFRPLSNAADSILLVDFISCPYLEESIKEETIIQIHRSLLGADCTRKSAREIVRRGSWISFTDWASDTDLASMLARKELTPAYE